MTYSAFDNKVCLLSCDVSSNSICFYALNKLALKDASRSFIIGDKHKHFVSGKLYYLKKLLVYLFIESVRGYVK